MKKLICLTLFAICIITEKRKENTHTHTKEKKNTRYKRKVYQGNENLFWNLRNGLKSAEISRKSFLKIRKLLNFQLRILQPEIKKRKSKWNEKFRKGNFEN